MIKTKYDHEKCDQDEMVPIILSDDFVLEMSLIGGVFPE